MININKGVSVYMKTLTGVFAILTTGYCKSQEIVTIDSVYEKSDELRLFSKVIEFDSSESAANLKLKFKKWASLKFRNLSEVITSEIDDQITLNYIDYYIYDIGLGMSKKRGNYYNMVAQFKQGKIRILIFDDGNVYVPSTGQGTYPLQAHTTHYSDWFITRSVIENKGAIMKPSYRAVRGYIDNNREFLKTLESELTKPIAPILKDDW
jgi:hypothetical protein